MSLSQAVLSKSLFPTGQKGMKPSLRSLWKAIWLKAPAPAVPENSSDEPCVVFSVCGLRPFSNKTLTISSHLLETFHDSLRLKTESTHSMQTSQATLTTHSIRATFL